MGAALYIVAERDIPNFDIFVNGKALSKVEQELSHIAEFIGVTPLMYFFSQNVDEALAFIEGEGGDVGDIDFPDETWFDADDGLASVRAIAKHLKDNPGIGLDVPSVMRDLDEFEHVLKRLLKEDIRWHLSVDF